MTALPSKPLQEPVRLQFDQRFMPCPVEVGDELYPNGIFEFNITRLLAFVRSHAEQFPGELIELADLPDYGGAETLAEAAVLVADLSRPILLAEIAPDRYNVIDGHHRVAKARREGVAQIPAYRVRSPEHVPFLTSIRAYKSYVEYWNGKLDDISLRGRRVRRRNPRSGP